MMKYISTRGNYRKVSDAEAIKLGMVPSGGLFVPEKIPQLSPEELNKMIGKSYSEVAYQVLKGFLSSFSKGELKKAISNAYNKSNFTHEKIAPVVELKEDTYILELWYGPTAAFKDMALQLMPYLLIQAAEKTDVDEEIVILVATSGDTGKAALEGFKDVDGVKIIVFYPADGVSPVQEMQMITTSGNNTEVVGVEGNFDDCQNSVKEIFGSNEFNELLKNSGYVFSSANSINWGRLVPQIVYYFNSYLILVKEGKIEVGDKINITVPTGNFGNILAAYYAYRMGLPVNKFICASNENKVLTDFLYNGIYDLDRRFVKTISPSMDILISSNLERFLFEITGHDVRKIKKWYRDLRENGSFEIDEKTRKKINNIFNGEFVTEVETKDMIRSIFKKHAYTLDPHTAVGISAYYKVLGNNPEEFSEIPVIIDATASPYKFGRAVLESIKGKAIDSCGDIENEMKLLDELKELTGEEIHKGLKSIEKKEIKHKRRCSTEKIGDEIKDILGINNRKERKV